METSEGDPVPIRIFLQVFSTPISQTTINNTGLYLIIGLVLCSIFIAIAASTIALALKNFNPEPGAETQEDQKKYRLLNYFKQRYHVLHSTTLVSQILLSIALVAASVYYFYPAFPDLQYSLPLFILLGTIGTLVLVMILARQLAKIFQPAALVLAMLFYSLSRIIYALQRPLSHMLHLKDILEADREAENKHTTLRDILGQNSFAPNADEEKKILRGILNFSNIYVKQIMRPRTEVVAHNINTPFAQLCRYINDNRYSRVPIYNNSLDKIEGILYIKDLLPYLNQKNNFNWQELLHTPYFVPETQKIDILLQEFKRQRVHLAIVVDEYGGTSGIITLEDILEEIVGDIRDEFDEEEINYSKLDQDNFVFEGKTPLADVTRIMNLDTETFDEARGEAETLGGLLVEMLGEIPEAGEKINYNNFCFTVENADGRRVRRVKITKQETKSAEIQS